ncbi:MAG: molybdenum cofactor biosynthesis protein MoaB [Bacteroidetes bacterium]|nr:molybdenum cofactor biosynthesis protein MoaB [Bacteroidota bacterium]MCH8246401.1 molybdenum cofactor biosynthesis protein MoaB [Bacteroidota bacterium]MCZ6705810.1 molybdenum cofactor biosynthesis protein MoaB [Bacteroidota bacterium]MCZ6757710.1 molybdenum cofactor biosynthesis protein MoaB [Bacteroidota bacterium]
MGTRSHQQSAADLTVRCAIITCSDTRTTDTDTSGAYIRTVLEEKGYEIAAYELVKDEPEQIRGMLNAHVDNGIDAVMINGGTGIARRDTTYDVVVAMLEKTLPGFGEIFRMLSYDEIGAASILSRAVAGSIGDTLVFSMPGSTGAVRLAMDKLIAPDLRHLVWEIREH